MTSKQYNVLIPLYPGFNTLDVGGPLDVLCNYATRAKGVSSFKITIAADEEPVSGYEYLNVKAQTTIAKAISNVESGGFDILLIPGAGSTPTVDFKKFMLDPWLKDHNLPRAPIVQLVRAFLDHDNADDTKEKWLVSICVGGLIAGAGGAFQGREATTHLWALGDLKKYCDGYGYPAKSIERRRWVDGGFAEPAEGQKRQTRILSSGGISCGLDACLWLVEQLLGWNAAHDTAVTMDYSCPWNTDATKSWVGRSADFKG